MSGPRVTRLPDDWGDLEQTGLTQDIELPLGDLDDEALAALLELEENDGLEELLD